MKEEKIVYASTMSNIQWALKKYNKQTKLFKCILYIGPVISIFQKGLMWFVETKIFTVHDSIFKIICMWM